MNEYQRRMTKEDAAVWDTLAAHVCQKEGAEYVPARYDELLTGDDDEPGLKNPRYPRAVARGFHKFFAAALA